MTIEEKLFPEFYALVRKPKAKRRNCLRCRSSFLSFKKGRENYRLCEECHQFVDSQSALAQMQAIPTATERMSKVVYDERF
jgi:hypothetical protein